jgi:hypothetical protein
MLHGLEVEMPARSFLKELLSRPQVAVRVVPDEPRIGGDLQEIREPYGEREGEDERERKPLAELAALGCRSQTRDSTSTRSRFRP